MSDSAGRRDDEEAWRDARAAAMETVLGPSCAAIDLGVDPSGSCDLQIRFYRWRPDGVVAATSGLIGCDAQARNEQGNYELVICSRGEAAWAPDALRDLAAYTLRTPLNPGETMSIGSMTPPGSSVVAFLFCDFARFRVRGRDAGLLLCLGITAGELSQCREGRWRRIESSLKDAGVYPLTDLSRPSTARAVPVPTRSLKVAFVQLLMLLVLPFLLLPAGLVAWSRTVRRLGVGRTLGNSLRITKIRYRQPLRYMLVDAPGCALATHGAAIAGLLAMLRFKPEALGAMMAVMALGVSARWLPTASNKTFPLLVLALGLGLYRFAGATAIAWATTALVAVLACSAVMLTVEGARPPLVLFLGVSAFDQFKTLKRVQKAAPGLVVTLIDQAEEGVVREYERTYAGMGLDPTGPRLESLRTRPGLWEPTVLDLIDMVPIVVLDARVPSDHVLKEACWMLEPGRLHKVLFVTDERGDAPVLESFLTRNEVRRLLAPRLVDEDEVCDRVARFAGSRRA